MKGVMRFLGMMGYFSHFVDNYAKLCDPLIWLKKTEVPFPWVVAFSVGMGGVLLQDQGHALQPIAFASSTFNDNILHVEHQEFDIQTDNQALTWLYTHPKQVRKIGCWIAKLNNYRFNIVCNMSRDNVIADCLSRLYDEGEHEVQTNHVVVAEEENGRSKSEDYCIMVRVMPELFVGFKEWQKDDEESEELKETISRGKVSHYLLEKELSYFLDKLKKKKVFVPNKARDLGLKYSHSMTKGAQMGRVKTRALIRREGGIIFCDTSIPALEKDIC
ncbi:hypothetical protein PR048_024191 [Dryococelus australis]|uniref:Uncharacterized protein n=1 Tax=Dryococelus australis TaxID=614101 RepID=A0ABQ9GW70_9NEOP|nr:hypothetical protein PR048_024191 [Dryococelus australis]